MSTTAFIHLIKATLAEWSEDKASRHAAALAYYTSFSLAPLLVMIIAIAGLFGGRDVVHGYVVHQLGDLLGKEGGEFVGSMVESASKLSTGLIAAAVGLITLMLGALGVFLELQDALNTIWEVKPVPVKGMFNSLRIFVFKRMLSFAMLLVIVFLLLVSLVVSAGLAALGKWFGSAFVLPELILQALNFVVSLGFITILIALIFKYLPDASIHWRDVWMGAAMTALLFSLGKLAIGLYLGKSNVGTIFGVAGSLAILLIWVYYSSQIFFFGAEFTQVYANEYGSRIVSEVGAVRLSENDRRQQGIPHDNAPA